MLVGQCEGGRRGGGGGGGGGGEGAAPGPNTCTCTQKPRLPACPMPTRITDKRPPPRTLLKNRDTPVNTPRKLIAKHTMDRPRAALSDR